MTSTADDTLKRKLLDQAAKPEIHEAIDHL